MDGTLSRTQKERTDGAMLLGFQVDGNTLSTRIEDDLDTQMVYYYLEPIANYRSFDQPRESSTTIVSWRPVGEIKDRIVDWRQGGTLNVPEDLIISKETLAMLVKINGLKHNDLVELHLPALTTDGIDRVKKELDHRHGMNVDSGDGLEPIRLRSSTEYLDEHLPGSAPA